MSVLVIVEAKEGRIKSASLEVLSHAQQLATSLSKPLCVLAVGKGAQSWVASLEGYHVTKAFVADHEVFDTYHSERFVSVAQEAMQLCSATLVLAAVSAQVRDYLPRLAARQDVGMISEVTGLSLQGQTLTALRPVYSGKCFVEVLADLSAPVIVTCRPNSFKVNRSGGGVPSVEAVGTNATTMQSPLVLKELRAIKTDRPDLGEAEIIVSAGRSIKSAENFSMINAMADVIGAAVGASRAAVDAGYAPHAMQVGQTGKTVNPKLYIAAGISGAIQHLAGMRSSGTIVVINTDPEAPLFKEADYGIVGDMFEVVPLMTQAFQKLLKD